MDPKKKLPLIGIPHLQFTYFFAFMGGISEAVAGLYLLFGMTTWDRFLGQLLAT